MSAHAITPIRFGILGAAAIARAFCAGVADSAVVKVAAVASRDLIKARGFAKEFGLETSYGSYDALLADRDIDAVYIPLPNALHVTWSLRAARAGKHVLCEKPLATSAMDARALFDVARECGVYVVEAFPYRAQEQTRTMLKLIHAGEIGTIRLIQGAFTFVLPSERDVRWRPELGGGALLDVGCYPVSLARAIARTRPSRVTASAKWHESGVDETLVGTIEFDGGMLGQIACGLSSAHTRQALIIGTRGAIETDFYNHPPTERPPSFSIRRVPDKDGQVETVCVAAMNGFRAEAESFARLVTGGMAHWCGPTPEESCDHALILETLLRSARSGQTVSVTE